MRKLFMILLAVLLTATIFAQSPQKMSYQAIIRDASNKLVTSHAIGMRVSILQSSVTGTEIYKEIYNPNPQTNTNGLVTIEIGGGTVISGRFDTINWAKGTYFIKTETDPTGGTNYTITGTSQLLSVPYALYAKTAENGFSGNYNDLTNKPVNDGSETNVTAGNNIMVTGSGTIASPYVINDSIHKIGEHYGGGIVFYIYDNGRHGLIAATGDQSTGINWEAGTTTLTLAYADGIGAGKANTIIIISITGNGNGNTYAARVCYEYSVSVNGVNYADWYLLSKFELNLLYLQKTVVGGFTNNNYWSSTEFNLLTGTAWYQSFFDGSQAYTGGKSNNTRSVRAIRAF